MRNILFIIGLFITLESAGQAMDTILQQVPGSTRTYMQRSRISNYRIRQAFTAGTNITIDNGVISASNTAQVQSDWNAVSGLGVILNKPTIPTQYTDALARATNSGANGISYNSSTGVISKTKRQETYTGTSNASGVVTITYGTAYPATPNVQFSMVSTNPREDIRLTASSTTGCSFAVQLRVDVIGLLPAYTNVASRLIDITVTEK